MSLIPQLLLALFWLFGTLDASWRLHCDPFLPWSMTMATCWSVAMVLLRWWLCGSLGIHYDRHDQSGPLVVVSRWQWQVCPGDLCQSSITVIQSYRVLPCPMLTVISAVNNKWQSFWLWCRWCRDMLMMPMIPLVVSVIASTCLFPITSWWSLVGKTLFQNRFIDTWLVPSPIVKQYSTTQ